MAKTEIDQYLSTLEEPKRATLTELRDPIVAIVPDAEKCISYGIPAFKLQGTAIAGFAAFRSHLSHLPHSGSVIPQLATRPGIREDEGFAAPVDKPLPKKLVEKLLDARIAEAFTPRR